MTVIQKELQKIRLGQAVADRKIVMDFARSMNSPFFVAEMLLSLKIEDTDEARNFFKPQNEELLDPFLFNDMEKATEILLRALAQKSKIAVHGDYDVDGVSGTALLTAGLRKLGFENVIGFLPSRFKEGYGLRPATIEQFAQEGIQVLITIDTGITANDEIALARSHNMEVIVCDHHQEGHVHPPANAILNPQCANSGYPNKFLAGVGVGYKLICALAQKLELSPYECEELLDFVLLGTLADMMPVVGENRAYLKRGLNYIRVTKRPGIQALLRESKTPLAALRSQDILFKMTPLLNAAGRMGDPQAALDLLLSQTPQEAEIHLNRLRDANIERKSTELAIAEQVVREVEQNLDWQNQPILVLGSPDWHQGVIGIVASRVVEKFHKPVAVLSIENGIGKASCRSVVGFNWHKALDSVQDLLLRWGGHYFAAGFSVRQEHIEELRFRLNNTAAKIGFEPICESEIEAQYFLPFAEISSEAMEWLMRFEPFGAGNENPIFYSDDVIVHDAKVVGVNHLKLKLRQNSVILDAICFGMAPLLSELRVVGRKYRVAFTIAQNHWMGKAQIQLEVKAISCL